MTGFTPELVERVGIAIAFTAQINGGITNPDECAENALKASGIAELTEAVSAVLLSVGPKVSGVSVDALNNLVAVYNKTGGNHD